MDIMKEFEEYLPKWSEEKMQPIPTQEHMDRWSIAWSDFVKERLAEKHDEMVDEYLNMQYKTVGERKAEKAKAQADTEVVEEPIEEIAEPVVEVKTSSWDRVQAILNEKG